MTNRLPKYLTAAVGLGALTLGSSGCADNDSMLFVRQVIAVVAPECIAKPDVGGLFRSQGVLDVAFSLRYDAALLVGNQLTKRGDRDQVRTETSRVALRGSEVRLLDTSERLVAEFTVPGSGFVDPASGDAPGLGVMGTTLIPQSVGQKFAATGGGGQVTLIANVRVFGETLGGDDVESAELTYPIVVCNGCLVAFPVEADDPVRTGYQCTLPDEPLTGDTGSQCIFGQDEAYDCRLCCARYGNTLPGNPCRCG